MSPRDVFVPLTGNPFVDTGLGVVAALANLSNVEDLTFRHLKETYGNGSRLSSWNSHLRSFSLVFGTNNPLLQSSYGYEKNKGPSEANYAIYRSTVRNFLAAMAEESGPSIRCEACGMVTRFDFAAACRNAVEENSHKAVKEMWLGRNWFPLAGSMGSDAQALPSGSRSVQVCGKCLFAVHYLPLGVTLITGQLTILQSTYTALWYEMIRSVVRNVQKRLAAGEYAILGGRAGNRGLLTMLLEGIEHVQSARQVSALPSATTLNVWSFLNSSAAECGLEEITHPVLDFLWKAVRHGLHEEIARLLGNVKKEDTTLLDSVASGQDYWGIYPHNQWKGASAKLFVFYQTEACKRASRSIAVVRALARQYAIETTESKLRPKRAERLSDTSLREYFRQSMIRFALDGNFRLADYLDLFPLVQEDAGAVEVCSDGWNIFRYYLQHIDSCGPLGDEESPSGEMVAESTAVRYFAARIMHGYVAQSGKNRLLNRITDSDASLWWLMSQFASRAESDSGFTYEGWSRVAINKTGRLFIDELMFQMRLLWSEWMNRGAIPHVAVPELPGGTGLPDEVATVLNLLYVQYIGQRGRARFQTDVLRRLRLKEIGLQWCRQRFFDIGKQLGESHLHLEKQWEGLLRDEQGQLRSGQALFQIRLMLANLYRASGEQGTAKIA